MHSSPLKELLERYSQGERDLRDMGDRLHFTKLENIYLEGCNLDGTDLSNSILHQSTFKNIDWGRGALQGACLSEVCLSGCNFKQANFSNASLADCDLKFCIFSGASFEGAHIENCQLQHSIFINATYDDTTVFPPDFVPEDRGMVKVSISSPNPSQAGLEEGMLDGLDAIKAVLANPNEPGASDLAEEPPGDFTAANPATTARVEPPTAISTQDSQPADTVPKRKYYYRGRLVER